MGGVAQIFESRNTIRAVWRQRGRDPSLGNTQMQNNDDEDSDCVDFADDDSSDPDNDGV